MKKKFTLLTVLLSIFALITHAQTNCSGSATASAGNACIGDTIQLTGEVSSAGNALDLDGVDDYVNVSKKLNPGTDITISAWINTSMVIPNRGDIITSLGPGVTGYSLNLNASTPKKIGFWVGDLGGGYLFSSTSVNDGNWHHVAGTYNSGTGMASIYIDGVLDASGSRSANLYSDTTMRIGDCGGFGCPGYEFDGKIDEVRIWNVARSAIDIQNDMNKIVNPASPGLLAYYRFDTGSGTTAIDYTGNGHNGVLSDVSAWDVPSSAPIYPDIVYWTPNTDISDTSSLTPMVYPTSLPATYTLWYEDLTSGCMGSATTTIEEFNPVITADAPLVQCSPMSLNLDAGPGVSYLWSNGLTSQIISAKGSRYYSVTVTNGTGCAIQTDSVFVKSTFVRTLGPKYCNRLNYWFDDIIRTRRGTGIEDFNWEFVNLTTGDTTYHTSPENSFTLSDVNPPLQAGTNYGVRVRLIILGNDTACFGNTCQIGFSNFLGEGLNTYKLKFWACNKRIIDYPRVKATVMLPLTGSGTVNAYEFSVFTDAGCTNLLDVVRKNNPKGLLFFRDVDSMQTNTKYWCLVRGRTGLQWSAYGDTCFFITPPSFNANTTRLESNFCNKQLGSGVTSIKCDTARLIINPRTYATGYSFSIYSDSACTNLVDSVFKNNAKRRLYFSNTTGLSPSTKYWVLCYGRINGVFTSLNFGDTCSIITPSSLRIMTPYGDDEAMDVSAYPNPFDNTISISFSNEDDNSNADLMVYDLTGRMVYSKENISSYAEEKFGEQLNPGVYIAEIRQKEKSVKLKIMKTK